MTSMVASYPIQCRRARRAIQCQGWVDTKAAEGGRSRMTITGHSSGASCAATVAGLQTATWKHSSS